MQNKVIWVKEIMNRSTQWSNKKMRYPIIAMITLWCLWMSPLVGAQNNLEPKVMIYRSTVKTLGDTLRTELMNAIKEGGALNALKVCNIRAPEISQQIAKQSGFKIGRTSLKIRNSAHAPDSWEEKILKSFEARQAQGEDLQSLEHYEVIEQPGQRQIRYMKAIPTVELCLTCHGQAITPEIQAQLKALYPQDQATGFKVGDLRGAFTLTEPITSP